MVPMTITHNAIQQLSNEMLLWLLKAGGVRQMQTSWPGCQELTFIDLNLNSVLNAFMSGHQSCYSGDLLT